MTRLRVAMLAHSTLPRGGVVHAMSLCEALDASGARATLHAPDASGAGFFRAAACETRPFRVAPAPPGLAAMVEARIADYVAWFRRPENRGFDVYHAHDGLSGFALAELKREGAIPRYVRTVHHLDAFADPRLQAWEAASILQADALMTVSELWRRRLLVEFGRDAAVCGNGVDIDRYNPAPDGREPLLRARWGLDCGPIFLAVGGVEARKNTQAMLAAFALVQRELPEARFVVAGGASLLDHDAYRRDFQTALAALGASAAGVVVTGPLNDAEMPALYRIADALVFASVKEGFGLCVLEAMACGSPAVVSRLPPFTEHLGEEDVLFCDPFDPASIADAMRRSLRCDAAARRRGREIAARHDWRLVAQKTLAVYETLASPAYA